MKHIIFKKATILTTINAFAFAQMNLITSIDLSLLVSLSSIKTKAFHASTNLASLTLTSSLPASSIAVDAFKSTALTRESVDFNTLDCHTVSGGLEPFPFPCAIPTSVPTMAPTIEEFTFVDAFCGVSGETMSQTCRIEGGETLTVVGNGFSEINNETIEIKLGSMVLCTGSDITVHSKAANFDDVRSSTNWEGYERLTCTTPCFVENLGATLSVAVAGDCKAASTSCVGGNKVFSIAPDHRSGSGSTVVDLAIADNYGIAAAYLCVNGPTLTSVECVNPDKCNLAGAEVDGVVTSRLQVPPNEQVKITGTNFGKLMPSGPKVKDRLGCGIKFGDSVKCDGFISWSPTEIVVTMCADGGTNLQVKAELDSRGDLVISGSGTRIAIDVIIGKKVPRDLTLSFAHVADIFTATMTWKRPTNDAGHGYVVKWTTNSDLTDDANTVAPNGGRITHDKPVSSTSSTELSVTIPNIARGAVLVAKVGMAYSDDVPTPTLANSTTWSPEEYTADQYLQAATKPTKPELLEITYIGLSFEQTSFVDMLLRFQLTAFNGGTPNIGHVIYTTTAATGATTEHAGASIKLNTELMQLGVISKFPIDELANVSLTIDTVQKNGLHNVLETLTSDQSEVKFLVAQVPRPVTALEVTFDTAERGETIFSVKVEWTNGVEPAGNALVADHLISFRSIA